MKKVTCIDELLKNIHDLSSPIMAISILLERENLCIDDINRLKKQLNIVMDIMNIIQKLKLQSR